MTGIDLISKNVKKASLLILLLAGCTAPPVKPSPVPDIGKYPVFSKDGGITFSSTPANPPEFIRSCYYGEELVECAARMNAQIAQIQKLLKDHGIVPK